MGSRFVTLVKTLILVLLFMAFLPSAYSKGTIDTVQTMVSYEDLAQIMTNNLGQYFVLPLKDYETLKAAKEKNLQLLASASQNIAPPIEQIIKSTKIFAKISDNLAFIEATFSLEKLTNGYSELPILRGRLAIENVQLNNANAALISKYPQIAHTQPNQPSTRGYWDKYITISPLPPADNQPNLWANAAFMLPLSAKGNYECKINFIAPVANHDDLYTLLFNLPPSPITFFKMEMASALMSIVQTSIPDYSLYKNKTNTGSEFVGWAGANEEIKLVWRQKNFLEDLIIDPEIELLNKSLNTIDEDEDESPSEPPHPTPEPKPEPIKIPVKLSPLVYVHSQTLLSIGQTTIYGKKNLTYSISKAPISQLNYEIPNNLEITHIQAPNQYNHRIIKDKEKKILQIDLMAEKKDNYSISIFYEQPIEVDTAQFTIPEIMPLNIERELGSIAIESISSAELQASNDSSQTPLEGVYPIDPLELPITLKQEAIRPIILAYNHSKSPTNLQLLVKRYEPVEQKTFTADSMNVQTTFTTNSTSNTLIELDIRNNTKQYLLMQLAPGAEIASSLRNGEPIKTVSSKLPGMVQIPLEISQSTTEAANMRITINLKEPIPPIKWKGELDFKTPHIDIPVSNFNWTLYAPENYQIFNFEGSVERPAHDSMPFFLEGFAFISMFVVENIQEPAGLLCLLLMGLVILAIMARKLLQSMLKGFGKLCGGVAKTALHSKALVFLIVVAVIIGFFMMLTIPNFKKARTQSRDRACFANLRVIQGAVEMYRLDSNTLMSYLDLNTLKQAGYLKAIPECPDKGHYEMNHNQNLYCSVHGTIEQPNRQEMRNDHANFASGISKEMHKVVSPQYDMEGAFDNSLELSATRQKVAMPSRHAPAPESKAVAIKRESAPKDFGVTKQVGTLPLKSLFVKTKNSYQLERDLIIPEIDKELNFKINATYPKVKLCYMYKSITTAIKFIAFILAVWAGLLIYWAANAQRRGNLIIAAIIIFVLSIIDLKLEFIGGVANLGFWLTILFALAWRSIMIIKTKLAVISQEEMPSNSGRVQVLLPLLVVFVLLIAPIIGASNNADVSTNKEIRILAPFKDLSGIIPADGKTVFLTAEDYKYLKDIKDIPEPKVTENPHLFKINLATYNAEVEEKGIRIKAFLELELFKDEWKNIPLLSKHVIPTNLNMDNSSCALSIVKDNNKEYYGIITNASGTKQLEIDFFVKSEEERSIENTAFSLEIIPASINILNLTVNKENCSATIMPGIIKNTQSNGGKTKVTALIPPTPAFSLELFNKNIESALAAPEEEEEISEDEADTAPEPLQIIEEPTKVSIKSVALLQAKETFVSLTHNLELNIRGSKGIDELKFVLSAPVRVTNVINGAIVENWEQSEKAGEHLLRISFNSLIKGTHSLQISLEHELQGQKEKEYEIAELIPVGVEQSQGILGIGCIEELEISVKGAAEGYTPIATGEFHRAWKQGSLEKLPYAFRYFKHPNKLVVGISRPENIEMLSATIDKAEAISLINDEGYIISRVKYRLRNNSEQFLKIKLPSNHEIELWDSRAAGNPVNAGYDKESDTYNLPIVKSAIIRGEAQAFYAEVTYAYKIKTNLKLISKLDLELPKTHLPISELDWQLHSNQHSELIKLDGNLDLTEQSNLSFIFTQDSPVSQSSNQYQNKALNRDSETTGILPIRFKLPLTLKHVNFKMLQIASENSAPRLQLLIIGAGQHKKQIYRISLLLIGILLGFALIRTFISGRKILWGIASVALICLTFLAFNFKLYNADYIIYATVGYIILFIIYRLLSITPVTPAMPVVTMQGEG